MKYTAIFINETTGKYSTQFFVTYHDKNEAWRQISSHTPSGHSLVLIMPGEHLVYSANDISATNAA